MKYRIGAVLFLFLLMFFQSQVQAEPCPFERGGARIIGIDGPASQVKLVREGKSSSVEVGQCLFWNDHLDAGLASVGIKTPTGTIRIGRYQDVNTYDVGPPPKPYPAGDMEPNEAIQRLYARLTRSAKLSSPGLGRAGTGFCEKRPADSARRLSALQRLPEGHQRIGSDLVMLLLGWRPTLGREEIMARLTSANGKDIFAEQRVCGVAHVELPIPSGRVKPGDTLVATITTQPGEVLTWSIEIVVPASLVQPPDPIDSAWMLGAWRMETGGADIQMDAVSRLASGARDYLAAQEILSATLANLE
mgnify:CR=1 FL=1